jgi:hypothetical protein
MFFPFYSAVFLAFESGAVIGLRTMKIMSGGSGSHDVCRDVFPVPMNYVARGAAFAKMFPTNQ